MSNDGVATFGAPRFGRAVMASKWIVAGVFSFLLLELGARFFVRIFLEAGSTVHILGKFYVANATNEKNLMAFGMSSISWLSVALVLTICFFAFFLILCVAAPAMRNDPWIRCGILFSLLLVSIVTINIVETLCIGGVTDYLAWIDLNVGEAKIINFADIVLVVALIGVGVAYFVIMWKLLKGVFLIVARGFQ